MTTLDGKSLLITPVKDEDRQADFETALERYNKKYAKTLKRLAE